MEPEEKIVSLPFVTRKQLDFEFATTFALTLGYQTTTSSAIVVAGFTKAGAFRHKFNPVTTGVLTYETLSLPDVPIGVSVIDVNNGFEQGSLFCQLFLDINKTSALELCAGLVHTTKSISWPHNTSIDPRPGGGHLDTVQGTDPAAGVEISETVPGNEVWKIIAVRFTLVTAAVAVSRRVHLQIVNEGAIIFDTFNDVDQIISETKAYTCAAFGDLPDRTDDNDILIPIPSNLVLDEGSIIRTSTTNLDAGDNFGAPSIYVEKFWTE